VIFRTQENTNNSRTSNKQKVEKKRQEWRDDVEVDFNVQDSALGTVDNTA